MTNKAIKPIMLNKAIKAIKPIMLKKTIYQEHGFNSRAHYLNTLAEDYGLDAEDVITAANFLGETEDFDGLVSFCKGISGE